MERIPHHSTSWGWTRTHWGWVSGPGVETKLLSIHCLESAQHEVQRKANDIVILKLNCQAAFTHSLQLGCCWRPPVAGCCNLQPMFKIEFFNALQTRFGPSKIYLSQNNPSKCNPKLKMKTSLEVLNIIYPPQEPISVGHCHYKK